MAIPKNKDELLKGIIENFTKLKLELSNIQPELTKEKELEGHAKNTQMSIHDLMAYLNGWGQLVLKWNRRKDNGQKVDFPETGFKWNELGLLAQKFYQDFEDLTFTELQKEFENTVVEILELVEAKTNFELYEVSWYEKHTLGRMIQLNTSSPYQNAKARIRKWKKSTLYKHIG